MKLKIVNFLNSKKGIFLLLIFLGLALKSSTQPSPNFPVSYRIFTPFLFNPAIAGSKDFISADLLLSSYGKSSSQLLSGNMRLEKLNKEYSTSVATPKYSNIGIGTYFFNEVNNPTHNLGVGATGSYHLQLDKKALSFLSVGVSAKAIFNNYKGDPDISNPAVSTTIPNFDAGIYYYNPSFYAGISATNILGSPDSVDAMGVYKIPISRQYFLQAGYKILLIESINLLLEPNLILTTGDSIPDDIMDIIKPGLKIYAGDICIGTYINDFKKFSFFGQFKYKKTYIGAYFELPYNTAYYKEPIIVEFTFGVNISAVRTGNTRRNHW